MNLTPITHEGYELLHKGSIALSQVEANGICIDTSYLTRARVKCKRTIKTLHQDLIEDEVYEKWRRRFTTQTNLGSREQLGEVLFNVMKLPCTVLTKTGRPSCTDDVLGQINLPFVTRYLEIERWKKALSTYVGGIERETVGRFLHPIYNLHIAVTYRSSSDSPNFQNIPIHRPELAKLVRSAFIPRASNRHLVEFDFKGIEVAVAACYNKDPVLIKYVRDSTTDMHRDMACQCYQVTKNTCTKDIRSCTKNRFTFPEFYGSWYKAVAYNLWKGIDELKLQTKEGIPLKKHLRKGGIIGLGKCDPKLDPLPNTFEYHIQQVERDFWDRRFSVYKQWKYDWNDLYIENGYFDTLTGFRCSSLMDRKQCVNYPIQGSAFHCLLWCLIRIQALLKKYGLKSLIVGQIHDSILLDILKREMKTVFEIVQQVTTIDLLKYWDWIIVPMKIEAEVSPAGHSWYEKKEVII